MSRLGHVWSYLYGRRVLDVEGLWKSGLQAQGFPWISTYFNGFHIQWSSNGHNMPQWSYHSVGIGFPPPTDPHRLPLRSLSHEASRCIGPSPQPVLEATEQQVLNCLLSKNRRLVGRWGTPTVMVYHKHNSPYNYNWRDLGDHPILRQNHWHHFKSMKCKLWPRVKASTFCCDDCNGWASRFHQRNCSSMPCFSSATATYRNKT